MARYIGPSTKIARKFGEPIFGPDKYLEKKNMYSPLFSYAYRIFNEAGNKDAIKDMIIQACQFDKRNKEYIDVLSRIMYRVLPNYWYRRDKSYFD